MDRTEHDKIEATLRQRAPKGGKKWHYCNVAGSMHGTMTCYVCGKKIESGEYRYRPKYKHFELVSYTTAHRHCTEDDPEWARLDAERAAEAAQEEVGDVLAELDRRIELEAALYDGPGTDELRTARAVVAELIEAIKPLAALDLRPDGFDKRDDSQPVYARENSVITVGDVRRAQAALAACQSPTAPLTREQEAEEVHKR